MNLSCVKSLYDFLSFSVPFFDLIKFSFTLMFFFFHFSTTPELEFYFFTLCVRHSSSLGYLRFTWFVVLHSGWSVMIVDNPLLGSVTTLWCMFDILYAVLKHYTLTYSSFNCIVRHTTFVLPHSMTISTISKY